jgi:sigma-B regulation protein RsbU (phosphoserine phosphatase)
LEVAVRHDAVDAAFRGLSHNLVIGLCASIVLLVAMIVMGLRAPVYLRGNYLEREMQLARRVQSDLLPKAASVSPAIDFGASAVAADHVGGDFYDLFESDSGKVSIVLGDVSGKGIPAALLASVVQGAIRSSTATWHETACERINTMLCERSAPGQYATLFWAVFDPLSATLRYVNAGHGAPLLLRRAQGQTEKLSEGSPVLGLLPKATYSAHAIQVEAGDTLVVYSDGISEAANAKQEEFGDDRVREIGTSSLSAAPREICREIMKEVDAFSQAGSAPDDRTLLVIRFLRSRAALTA